MGPFSRCIACGELARKLALSRSEYREQGRQAAGRVRKIAIRPINRT
jgi:hypothetical protein